MTSMKDLYYRLKWALQRAYRGYDDTATWNFDCYLETGIPALKELCNDWLAEDYADLNPQNKEIMERTLLLIKCYEDSEGVRDYYDVRKNLFGYVGDNIDAYWN